jgi:uncharacterized protein (TIGR01777 family)
MSRNSRCKDDPAMNQPRIVIAGGSGFIGSALAREFASSGREVVILTRHPRERTAGIREILWDGEHPGEWVQCLDGAAAVINLTGKNINCPHTPENLRAIAASRVNSVNAISAAISQVSTPPPVWVQSSATGFYGDTGDRMCDEIAPNGNDALAKVCRDWEAACESASTPKTRRVILRIGFVLGRDGGALPVLSRLTKFFLGGAAGRGAQFISWIHLADLVRMFVTSVNDGTLTGTFNAVAPDPVTNREFMRELRHALHRPWSPPAPEFAVKFGARLMGSESSLALISQRCSSRKFVKAGFQFQFPALAPALRDLCETN